MRPDTSLDEILTRQAERPSNITSDPDQGRGETDTAESPGKCSSATGKDRG